MVPLLTRNFQAFILPTLIVTCTTFAAAAEPSNPSACAAKGNSTAICSKDTASADTGAGQRECANKREARLSSNQRSARDMHESLIATDGSASDAPHQIFLKIHVLEVSLTKMRQLGIDCELVGLCCGQRGDSHVSSAVVAADTTPGEDTVDTRTIPALVDELKRKNIAKSLAEPTLVTLSGRPAHVVSGGQVPLPGSDKNEGARFLSYGTTVDARATALSNNQVQIELQAEVSELDFAHCVTINGERIPGLRSRRCDTTCELPFGHSVVLTPSVEQRVEVLKCENEDIECVNEVALVVLVTPEAVPTIAARETTSSDGGCQK